MKYTPNVADEWEDDLDEDKHRPMTDREIHAFRVGLILGIGIMFLGVAIAAILSTLVAHISVRIV